jgi:hypothetical protein
MVAAMDDGSKNPFHYSILPFDPLPDEEPTEPSLECQQDALEDICGQLITYLTDAANDGADTTRAATILAYCDVILGDYAEEGFTLLGDFREELRSDLRSALRKARQMARQQLQ